MPTISWLNLSTGQTGTGTRDFPIAECQAMCDELNRDYPGFHHEPSGEKIIKIVIDAQPNSEQNPANGI